MRILAIDPGPTESAYIVIDAVDKRPLTFTKCDNPGLRARLGVLLRSDPDMAVAIEMVASYGMAVGAEVFETCVWIGRFAERADDIAQYAAELVPRRAVKMWLCHNAGAKDTNIAQALIDRFAPGAPNRGKGTQAAPGWFHGFAGDIWQAYALAVTVADGGHR
jgi:hypothetical protein